MSILVDENTLVVVQGLTGNTGTFHARRSIEYGTKIVAGVTPGKGGTLHEGVPVFDTVEEAVRKTGADASVIFVPPPYAADAIMEAADAKIKVIVCITEGIPVLDTIRARRYVKERGATLIGPNCPGIITPDKCRIGIMPGYIHRKGTVGIISRSGTLTYEAVWQITRLGLGQSTCVGIGGDPVVGTGFVELLALFEEDPQTQVILIIGEIGGTEEEEAAEFIRDKVTKPVVAFVAGLSAPKGKRMGHAGAIIAGGEGTAADKIRKFSECGVAVAESPAVIGETVARELEKAGKK